MAPVVPTSGAAGADEVVLDPDCMAAIAKCLDLRDRVRLQQLSKAWQGVVRDMLSLETRLDLYAFRARIDDCGLAALARACPRVLEVNLCSCERLSDASLEALAVHCPELRDANVSCVRAFSFAAIHALCERCPVRDLSLAGCSVDAALIRKHLSHLVELEDEDGAMGSTD